MFFIFIFGQTNIWSGPTLSGEVVPTFVFGGAGTRWLVSGGGVDMAGALVFTVTAGVVDPNAPAVG